MFWIFLRTSFFMPKNCFVFSIIFRSSFRYFSSRVSRPPTTPFSSVGSFHCCCCSCQDFFTFCTSWFLLSFSCFEKYEAKRILYESHGTSRILVAKKVMTHNTIDPFLISLSFRDNFQLVAEIHSNLFSWIRNASSPIKHGRACGLQDCASACFHFQ